MTFVLYCNVEYKMTSDGDKSFSSWRQRQERVAGKSLNICKPDAGKLRESKGFREAEEKQVHLRFTNHKELIFSGMWNTVVCYVEQS